MAQSDQKKSARLEARLPQSVYALVQHAASLQGRSITDFVVSAAQQAAEAAIEQRQLVELSKADQERFAAALLEPVVPTPAMARAAAAHKTLIERS